MLTNDQDYEKNKKEFIARLVEAGWKEEDAKAEWVAIQADDEAGW